MRKTLLRLAGEPPPLATPLPEWRTKETIANRTKMITFTETTTLTTIGIRTPTALFAAHPKAGDTTTQPKDPLAPAVLAGIKHGVAIPSALWPQGSTLRISLIGMTHEQEQLTRHVIDKWAPHVNLKFEFTDAPDGDIRILADSDRAGGESAIGTQARSRDPSQPTMIVGFQGGSTVYNAGTILHEFGHALGLHHEHQHPQNTLDLNWEQILQDHRDRGEEDKVPGSFFPLGEGIRTSAYDQKSTMHYGIPSAWLNSGGEIADNPELSQGDREFVQTLYPPQKKELASPPWWHFLTVPNPISVIAAGLSSAGTINTIVNNSRDDKK